MDIFKLKNNFEKNNKDSKNNSDENSVIFKDGKNKTKTKCCPFCGSFKNLLLNDVKKQVAKRYKIS